MDPPVLVKKEVEDAEAPSMEEDPPEALETWQLEQDHLNSVTVAQLPPSYYLPTPSIPKPYPDPPSSSSVKGKKVMEKNPKITKGPSCYPAENTLSDYRRKALSDMQNGGHSHAGSLSGEARSNALLRGVELKSNLGHTFPSFVKSLVRSHVASCFWLGLPAQFCRDHLLEEDTNIILEDECGELSMVKYIAYKTGLSAGWRQFSARHNLHEGDVLVFQLVEPTKFKVYIIRANNFTEVDGALGLQNLESQTKQSLAVENANAYKDAPNISKRKRPKSIPRAVLPKKNKNMNLPRFVAYPDRIPGEPSEYDSEVGSEVLEEFKLSSPSVQFENIEKFEDFKFVMDAMVKDAELSEDICRKYYKLCRSQNAFLHDEIVHGINSKLISGCISETVNIADAIKACKFTTSRGEFTNWDKTLTAFEILGMNVGFLRTRLHRLVNLIFESEGAKETRRYVEAKIQRAEAENEIRNIEVRIEALKQVCRRSSVDMESLKSKAERYELKLQEVVFGPW